MHEKSAIGSALKAKLHGSQERLSISTPAATVLRVRPLQRFRTKRQHAPTEIPLGQHQDAHSPRNDEHLSQLDRPVYRRHSRIGPLLALAFVALLWNADPIRSAEPTFLNPAEIAAHIKSLQPYRKGETFPLTAEEYQRISEGQAVFRGREVPGSDILEGAVARLVKAPTWKVWRVILDEEHHNEYMPQIKYATVLKGQATGRMIFDFLELPAVSNRQWVVEATHQGKLWTESNGSIWLASFRTPANQQELIAEALASKRIPTTISALQYDTVTIRESRASYTLIQIPDGRTVVEYRAFSDPAGKIPAWLLNMGAKSTMEKLVSQIELRAQSADTHFKAKNHPIIYDPLNRAMGNEGPPQLPTSG